jgi:hypothetical protein
MKRIEDLIGEKIEDLIHYILLKIIKPDITVDKITELSIEEIRKLKKENGIEGIVIDVDETLRKELKCIPKVNQEWIETIRGELKVIILSNGKDRDIERYFKKRGIDYISFAHKPLKKNFLKACEKMKLQPNQVLSVGDNLLDDIYGGKRNNMKTVLVENVEDDGR